MKKSEVSAANPENGHSKLAKAVNGVSELISRLVHVEPADTDYEYALPLAAYSGPVDSMVPQLRASEILRYGKVVSPALMTELEAQDQS